tara:strand:+ start:301 stop:480 length:180 start_codon:yes stop_codon:yes gene_type:complete
MDTITVHYKKANKCIGGYVGFIKTPHWKQSTNIISTTKEDAILAALSLRDDIVLYNKIS